MKIGVIIPIINDRFINGLLDCIDKNSVLPESIIVIDNSKDDDKITIRKMRFRVEIYRPPTPLGVNASWNHGINELIKKDVDLVSVLNDDLLLENLFFEKMIRLASLHEEAGVFCPTTVKEPSMIHCGPMGSGICTGMHKREGWAWTIQKSVAKKIPPIPDLLKTFCGDDWYWHHCYKLGRPWMKMSNTLCYHFVGVSKDGIGLKNEKAILQNLL
jgi:GT2 family glycosyltransferase